MAYADRLAIIQDIERQRGSTVLCYLTSLRQGAAAQMAEDAVRVFFDHIRMLPTRRVPRLDIFLCSNGGNGVVPWRLISLFREFADHIAVLIPFRAYSAATMLALGADEIVMHPFAEMGPIDPTVSNEFNPVDPLTQQRYGISVEDVKAYISFVKDTVGITHEDELIKAVEILATRVHPLALGNVERFISQSRMIARKILLTHMDEATSKHRIDEIIETLASKLYFHGHPINRKEARIELGLKIVDPVPKSLEDAMWDLYLDFEVELKNREIFDPMSAIFALAATNPAALQPGMASSSTDSLAVVECGRMSTAFEVERRFVVVGMGPQGEPLVRAETLSQGWNSRLPSAVPPAQPQPQPAKAERASQAPAPAPKAKQKPKEA